jgi:hypothetical protein
MTRTILAALMLIALALPTAAQQRPPAKPEPDASLLKRAPKLAVTGKVVPLKEPLEIGGTGWGPFSRLCVERMLINNKGKEVPETEPSCFTVEEAKHEGGTWQLAIRTDPIRGGPRVAFATSRDGAGAVGAVAITPPEGMTIPAERLEGMQTVFRVMLEAHGLPRMTVQPREEFIMPLQLAKADPDTTAERGGFVCRPDGSATLRGRAVLVAQCRATARTDLGDGAVGRVDMAGRFAIDIATGMVLQHGYASFLFMEKNPEKAMPDLRWKGVSRQSLE